MAYESTYSNKIRYTNVRYKQKINRFFAKIGYTPKWGKSEPAAMEGEEVAPFRVPQFKPSELEGKLLREWQNLPTECS
jgi:hypothetical protein